MTVSALPEPSNESTPLRLRKKTKIVATLGPASDSEEVMRAMFDAGVNVCRFNMSHGTHAEHLERLQKVRRISKETDRPIAVLIDLQGPKIRTGRLERGEPVQWHPGQHTVITVAHCPEGNAQRVGTTYAGLAEDVKVGDVILIDDGRMRLKVEAIKGDDVHCVIEVGGLLKNNKGMNLPGVKVGVSSLSEKDKDDLAWAIEQQVDFIALSFVRNARDVRHLKNRIGETGHLIPVIAKVERADAVENIDEILAEADGIMVARGDLGIEISIPVLPIVQKELILRANRLGKLVITATQMLESMIEGDIPSRAEATDIANAVFDGTDAVMLSGETTVGKNPVLVVQAMSSILLEAERSRYLPGVQLDTRATTFSQISMTVTRAADLMCRDLEADAIMVFSKGPEMALLLSKQRNRTPMIVVCQDERAWRTNCLIWGIGAVLVAPCADLQDLLEAGIESAVAHRFVRDGQRVIVAYGFPEQGVVNVKLHRI
jgi:pyruvate kinase